MSDGTKARLHGLIWVAPLAAVIYPLSSGPVIAVGCKLRDITGWDVFYFALAPYVPILSLAKPYIAWWIKLLGTVGPG